MPQNRANGVRRLMGLGAFSMVVVVGGALAQPGLTRVDRLMYLGNPSCTGAKCHSGDVKMQSGQEIGDEFDIWSEFDPHAKAFRTLSSEDSKAMASKLTIGDATSSARCLSCHATNVPEAQRGKQWAFDQAVSCEACHGPGEKYREPHAKAGWTAEQRKALDANGMRDTHGLLDTSHLGLRATMCTACHLQIDKDMIDAGHPELKFEMGAYNEYLWDENYETHWTKPAKDPVSARLWAIGQMVSLDAAKGQVEAWRAKNWETGSAEGLVALYAKGAEIAQKHFGAAAVAGLEKANISAASAGAAAADLAAQAGSAKNQQQREILLYGVASLVATCFDLGGDDLSNEFWDAFEASLEAEGEAFVTHVKTLAALAK